MYVYLIKNAAGGYIKIGRARDPWARMRALQTASPEPLYLVGVVKCVNSAHAARVEALTHEHLEQSRACGEWFKAPGSNSQVLADIKSLANDIANEYEPDQAIDDVARVLAIAAEDLSRLLSVRELHVLKLFSLGMNTATASRNMGLSVKTVSTYTTRVAAKLGISGHQVRTVAMALTEKLSGGSRQDCSPVVRMAQSNG